MQKTAEKHRFEIITEHIKTAIFKGKRDSFVFDIQPSDSSMTTHRLTVLAFLSLHSRTNNIKRSFLVLLGFMLGVWHDDPATRNKKARDKAADMLTAMKAAGLIDYTYDRKNRLYRNVAIKRTNNKKLVTVGFTLDQLKAANGNVAHAITLNRLTHDARTGRDRTDTTRFLSRFLSRSNVFTALGVVGKINRALYECMSPIKTAETVKAAADTLGNGSPISKVNPSPKSSVYNLLGSIDIKTDANELASCVAKAVGCKRHSALDNNAYNSIYYSLRSCGVSRPLTHKIAKLIRSADGKSWRFMPNPDGDVSLEGLFRDFAELVSLEIELGNYQSGLFGRRSTGDRAAKHLLQRLEAHYRWQKRNTHLVESV